MIWSSWRSLVYLLVADVDPFADWTDWTSCNSACERERTRTCVGPGACTPCGGGHLDVNEVETETLSCYDGACARKTELTGSFSSWAAIEAHCTSGFCIQSRQQKLSYNSSLFWLHFGVRLREFVLKQVKLWLPWWGEGGGVTINTFSTI